MERKQKKSIIAQAIKILHERSSASTPEQNLVMGIITQAVTDRFHVRRRRSVATKPYKHECERFFNSDGFSDACDYVGLDPDYVRSVIAKTSSILKEDQTEERRTA